MILHVVIKNFGKVESADISLRDFVVFVGNNNSGKTMIMQLIYGLRMELRSFPVTLAGAGRVNMNGQRLIRCSEKWFREVELQVNQYLEENKSRMIRDIFGETISAEEIKIVFEEGDTSSFVCSISETSGNEEGKTGISIDVQRYKEKENAGSYQTWIEERKSAEDVESEAVKFVWRIILFGGDPKDSGQLFLPAARSGLQLLYRHYFAGEVEGNLVQPIKDFLRFLQLYTEDKEKEESRRSLLEFGEEQLLEGKILQKGDETFYVEGDRVVPLQLASSMIHELTPFIKALSATQKIDWLYCDEVENSIHPLLQREMARWIIRMVNAGIHVVVSSHSDTMASRLNNLFMLSQLDKRKADYAMLEELELLDADLLRPDVKAGIYEFRRGEQGKTRVEELEFMDYPLIGYDFQLFGKNLDKLYDEADRITR